MVLQESRDGDELAAFHWGRGQGGGVLQLWNASLARFVFLDLKPSLKCNPPKSGANPIMSSTSAEIDIPSVVCVIY